MSLTLSDIPGALAIFSSSLYNSTTDRELIGAIRAFHSHGIKVCLTLA
jgi:hypothetical protein